MKRTLRIRSLWRCFAKVGILASLVLFSSIYASAQTERIATGDDFGAFIDDKGNLFLWGAILEEADGGNIQVAGLWREVSVSRTAAETAHILAIADDGSLWAWGSNSRGQLGVGDQVDRVEPERISSSTDWVEVATGEFHSLARKSNGRVFAWGDNSNGQLNLGGSQGSRTSIPSSAIDSNSYIAISAGNGHSHAVRSDGTLWTWGTALTNGQLSGPQLGILVDGRMPIGRVSITQVGTGSDWTNVFGGYSATFGTRADGELWVWGAGSNLGLAGIGLATTPTRIGSDTGWASVSFSSSSSTGHAIGLRSNGDLFGWGINYPSGALGLPFFDGQGRFLTENTNLVSPTSLQAGDQFLAVGVGEDFSVVIDTSGALTAAGVNDLGQLANGAIGGNLESNGFNETALGIPDLVVTSMVVSSPQDLSEGDNIDVQLLIRNIGTGEVTSADLAGIEYEFWLSPSTTLGAEGELALSVAGPTYSDSEIGPSASVSADFSFSIPSVNSGDYYILASIDSSDFLRESSEENNFISSDSDSPLLLRADLLVSFLSASPTVVNASGSMTVGLTFTNSGAGDIASGSGNGFDYRVFLSEFEDENLGDRYELLPLGEEDSLSFIDGLEAGRTSSLVSVELTVPDEVDLTKDYFIGLVVDSEESINESDESNNADFSSSAIIAVNGLLLTEALDLVGRAGAPSLTTEGDSNWFGQTNVSDAFGSQGGAARSPSLDEGEVASITFSFSEPREITFRWRSSTTSSANRLFFGANRVPLEPETVGQPIYLFGNRDWAEVSYVVPSNTPVGFFYEQGTAAAGDVVYLDNLRISEPITDPDFVIQSIEFESGDYVLQRDRLSVVVTGTNRGESISGGLPLDFEAQVWLSRDQNAGDEDDISLGRLESFQILDNGNRFVYEASFELPESLVEAPYYVLARVDSGNVVAEYNEEDPFSDNDNNFRFSDTPGVVIDRRANLRVTPITVEGPSSHPDYQRGSGEIYGQFVSRPISGDDSEILILFDIINDGLSHVEGLDQAFEVEIYLSRDSDADLTSEADSFLLTSFTEQSGLAFGESRTYEITSKIPETVAAGDYYFIVVNVDPGNTVPESNEENNVTLSVQTEAFVGEVPLTVALNDEDLDDPDRTDPETPWETREWNDGFPTDDVSIDPSDSPWFGQTVIKLDTGVAVAAAAQSGPVNAGGTSYMETIVSVESDPVLVSFQWSVSSQFQVLEGVVREDVLDFSVRAGDAPAPFVSIAQISGEQDWSEVEYVLDAGDDAEALSYTLRWSYIENGDGTRSGADAGWVENFSANSPDYTLSSLSNPGRIPAFDLDVPSGVLTGGSKIGVSFVPLNLAQPEAVLVPVQIRLSPEDGNSNDLDWSVTGPTDIILFDGIVRIDNPFDQALVIPETIGEIGDYYVGVWIDYEKNISERVEGNNLVWTDSAVVRVEPKVSFDEATGYAPAEGKGWDLVGDGRWFPTETDFHPESSGSTLASVTNPELRSGQSAGFEAIVDGPRVLHFRWKANTRENLNYADVRINGQPQFRDFGPAPDNDSSTIQDRGTQMRISGVRDWVDEYLLIPAGTQVVSWHYVKNADLRPIDGDSVFVDLIDFEGTVDLPDLMIQSVEYNPSETDGSQQYVLERDQFPISVVVVNRGAEPSGFDYNDIEVEIRLSSDDELDDTDQVIGNLALTQSLDAGQRLLFSGNVDLPINLPDRTYYLLARVNSLDPTFEEFSLEVDGVTYDLLANNEFASVDQDIEILHLPRLVTEMNELIADRVYYPKDQLYLEWDLINIGLGDIDGFTPYETRVELWAAPISALGGDGNIFDSAELLTTLATVIEREYLPGVLSRDGISESTLSYRQHVTIPRAGDLLSFLGTVSSGIEDEDIEVVSNLDQISENIYFITLVRDTEIPQSSDLAVTPYYNRPFVISPVPALAYVETDSDPDRDYEFGGLKTFGGDSGLFWDYEQWYRHQDFVLNSVSGSLSPAISLPTADASAIHPESGLQYLYHYALNLPLGPVSSASGLRYDVPQGATYRVNGVAQSGNEYRSLTFPIVRGATDLAYSVEVRDGVSSSWEPLVRLEPPYLDSRGSFRAGYYGAQSLTSPRDSGSLINSLSLIEGGDTDSPVVSVVDQNYTALVTVRDVLSLDSFSDPNGREMRLVVEEVGGVGAIRLEAKSMAPEIVNQSPEEVEVAIGDPLFLGVQAYGGDLVYEWFSDQSLDGFEATENTNGSSLSLPVASEEDSGTYYVRVSNSEGVVLSAEMLVRVTDSVVGSWYADAVALSDGWMWSAWLGFFNGAEGPWIFHDQHGWLYSPPTSADSVYFWDGEMETFYWTSETVYPYLYRFSDQKWIFYDLGSESPRWFVDLLTGVWEAW